MIRHIVLFVILLVFWVALSGQVDYTDAHQRYLMACGVVSSLIGTWLAARVGFLYDEGPMFKLAIRQPLYLLWLFRQVVISNIDVARRVWSPRPSKQVRPKLVRVNYETESDLATVIFANSITLTPGTVTVLVDTEKKEILVHALTEKSAGGLEDMHKRVRALEGK